MLSEYCDDAVSPVTTVMLSAPASTAIATCPWNHPWTPENGYEIGLLNWSGVMPWAPMNGIPASSSAVKGVKKMLELTTAETPSEMAWSMQACSWFGSRLESQPMSSTGCPPSPPAALIASTRAWAPANVWGCENAGLSLT